MMLMIFKGFQSKHQKNSHEDYQRNDLICKFVFNGLGHPIGESISVEHDLIIVKTDDSFLGIPLKHVEADGKKVIVKGLVDKKNAKKLGERWRKREEKKEGIMYDR
jgi:hypothetical protein